MAGNPHAIVTPRYVMPRITPQMAAEVGQMVGRGTKLIYALASLVPPVTLEHWKRSLDTPKTGGSLVRAFEAKRAEQVTWLLDKIRDSEGSGWQRYAWVLERVHGYTTEKHSGVTVNVNTINGMSDDVWQRAKTFLPSKSVVTVEPK